MSEIDDIIQRLVDADDIEAANMVRTLRTMHDDKKAIVTRIWRVVDMNYDELNGRSIYEVIQEFKEDAMRYRHLRDNCSSHYPMTWGQPAEWSISWEFQQATPDERYGSFDHWIDRDIASRAEQQAAHSEKGEG